MRALLLTLACALAGSAREARTQVTQANGIDALKAPGAFKLVAPRVDRALAAVPDARELQSRLQRMVPMLQALPPLDNPVGFDARAGVEVRPQSSFPEASPAGRRAPVEGYAYVDAIRFTVEHGALRRNDGYTSGFAFISIWANTLSRVFDDEADDKDGYWRDSIGRMRRVPRRGADYMGYPTYISSIGQRRVVITNRKEPLFIPVERERVLRLFIAEDRRARGNVNEEDPLAAQERRIVEARDAATGAARAMYDTVLMGYRHQIAEARPQLDSLARENVALLASHERLLASMTLEERRAPATFNAMGRLAANPFAPAEQMISLVQPNPAFFDAALSRGEIQLLMFDLFDDGKTTIAFQEPRFPEYQRQLLKGLDLKMLAGMIR